MDTNRLNPNLYAGRLILTELGPASQPTDVGGGGDSTSGKETKGNLVTFLQGVLKLFDKHPDMVNRLVLEMLRYFNGRGDYVGETIQSACQQLKDLRRYLSRLGGMLTYPRTTDPARVDFMEQYPFVRRIGVGLTKEEAFSVSISAKYLLYVAHHLETTRFWGKIYGTEKDYYIIECDLTPAEIENRTKQKIENLELARQLEKLTPCKSLIVMDSPCHIDKTRPDCAIKECVPVSTNEIDLKILELKGTESKLKDFIIPERPGVPVKEDPTIPEEDIGFGTNKKLYLVSNNPMNGWCELPTVHPLQISVGRKIKRFFTGDLDRELETSPCFPGTEVNYLRCQIARISASTQVSPIEFYKGPGGEEAAAAEEEGDVEFGPNPDYVPLPPTRLGNKEKGPSMWVHHADHILEQGRTIYWAIEKKEAGEGMGEASDTPGEAVGPPLLTPISKDKSPICEPWSVYLVSELLPAKAVAVARSNLWPGSWAWTYRRKADHIYVGWGHKLESVGITVSEPHPPAQEYPDGPEVMEFPDPTAQVTKDWIERHTPPPPPPPREDLMGEHEGGPEEGQEEEEEEEEEDDEE